MKQKIVVTGASGFLGNCLLTILAQKKDVEIWAISRKPESAPSFQNVRWVKGDILDEAGLEDIINEGDQVYHLAGYVSFLPNSLPKLLKINAEGTANVVNACLEKNISKLLHVSTVAAIGRSQSGDIISEKTGWKDSPLNTQYAISKYLAENEVWRGMAEGLNAVIVNPSVILGAGDWAKGSSALFRRVAEGLNYYPMGKTGFVAAEDVAKAMVHFMEGDYNEERYILSAENRTWREFLTEVALAMHKTPPTQEAGALLSNFSWRVEKIKSWFSGKTPVVTKETAMTSSNVFEYNAQKSVYAGIIYQPISEVIRSTTELFLKNSV